MREDSTTGDRWSAARLAPSQQSRIRNRPSANTGDANHRLLCRGSLGIYCVARALEGRGEADGEWETEEREMGGDGVRGDGPPSSVLHSLVSRRWGTGRGRRGRGDRGARCRHRPRAVFGKVRILTSNLLGHPITTGYGFVDVRRQRHESRDYRTLF